MNSLGECAENRKIPASYNHSKSKKDRKLGRIKEGRFEDSTTMIGHNKWIKARALMLQGKKVFFFFSFRDRLSFYPVPVMLPNSVEIRDGGTYLRGCEEIKKHLYIPVGLLYDERDFPSYDRFKYFLSKIYK